MPALLVKQLTQVLAERLSGAGAFGDEPPEVRVLGKEGWIGIHDRWLVRVVPAGDRVDLWSQPADGGPWLARPLEGMTDLDAAVAAIEDSVRAWAARLTPYRLQAGAKYRVARPFVDFHRNEFAVGEVLTFVDRSFLPYEDGHTLRFQERTMWVQGGTPPYEDFGLNVVPA